MPCVTYEGPSALCSTGAFVQQACSQVRRSEVSCSTRPLKITMARSYSITVARDHQRAVAPFAERATWEHPARANSVCATGASKDSG
jgi:hypothetical protein